MRKRAFPPSGDGPSLHLAMDLPSIWRWRLSDCRPPGLGLERNRSCQTRHDAGRSAMNRSGCSLQACRTPHAASVLPLRTCYGGGVFHAEAGLPSIWRWRLSDCRPPGLGLERNRSCQTRHDAGRSAMNRSGCSLQACRTPHAASVLPLRTCYGGGVFHAEAGDLMGQFGTRPSLR